MLPLALDYGKYSGCLWGPLKTASSSAHGEADVNGPSEAQPSLSHSLSDTYTHTADC